MRDIPKVSKTTQSIAIGLSCLLELFVKTLLLRTPHTLAAGRGRFHFKPSGSYLPCCRDFIVPESAMQASGGEEASVVFPGLDPACCSMIPPGKMHQWCSSVLSGLG